MSSPSASHSDPHGPEMIMQMMQGAQASGILKAGIECGVFGHVAAGATTAAQVAERARTPPRSTGMLMNALAALGLLTKNGDQYGLSPTAAEHLVPGKPMYMGELHRLFAGPMMFDTAKRMTDAVKNDGTVLEAHAETAANPFWETFAQCTAAIAMPGAMALTGMLDGWLSSRPQVRVLDIACGSGLYGLTLARNPRVQLTLLDWPNVLAETRQWAQRVGADASRVSYIEGNLFEVDYQGPYDLILLSHVYHHFDPPTCQKLTSKVAAAVAPGGRVAIQDFLFDDTLKNPMPAMFAMIMLGWTRHGMAYAERDYQGWLEAAGLKHAGTHGSQGMPASWVFADK
jgi:2-polyprenyl-3-methyl-5-hydroxy-6-metoxy-1,4-benzoquinol methylase